MLNLIYGLCSLQAVFFFQQLVQNKLQSVRRQMVTYMVKKSTLADFWKTTASPLPQSRLRKKTAEFLRVRHAPTPQKGVGTGRLQLVDNDRMKPTKSDSTQFHNQYPREQVPLDGAQYFFNGKSLSKH